MNDSPIETTVINRRQQTYYSAYADFPASAEIGDLAYATDNLILYRWNGAAWQEISITGTMVSGKIVIFPHDWTSVGQGTWVIYSMASQFLNGYLYNTSNADLDNISFPVALQKGTYTLKLLTFTQHASGILKIYINSDLVATWDLYTLADTFNVIKTQAAIVVATSGFKTLTLKVDGANGASIGHTLNITAISLIRTA